MTQRLRINIILLLIIALAFPSHAFCQDIPSDSLILGKIFGKTDRGGKTYSCGYKGYPIPYAYEDTVEYRITFKGKVNIDNEELILSLVEAPYGNHCGHKFGFSHIYYFKVHEKGIELFDSIKSDGRIFIGHYRRADLLKVGKNRMAIKLTIQGSGNGHMYTSDYLYLFDLNKLTHLITINIEYNNNISRGANSETDSCEVKWYEESFEIIPNDREWYDIKVKRTDYEFTKGCQERYIGSEDEKVYIYQNGEYTAKPK